ncbi:SDR family oxidoreductase [Paractinoplanes brasiliensis]|nr:SDR family oxidoreductase [Actinoplanes brasiliensis]GID26217.1 NAD(P)-dependent oxidoreductase [Actinoplanes brasiliensis]
MGLIVISGATGHLGGRVARRMTGPMRLLVRDAGRAPDIGGAELAVADYRDTDAVARALEGADTVLMVSASESPDRVDVHRGFVDAAVAAGVGHLVYTSFVGASPDATFTLARDHWATEQHVRDSGPAFTFLRDNLYADFLPFLVGDDGVIRGPVGDGRAAVVAQDDIADAITAVLQAPEAHAGRTYDLTGPAALTLAEVAETISTSTGRPVRFHNESVPEAYASRSSYGAPDWQVEAWVSTYTAIAAGELAHVSTAVEDLTGHPATSLADLLARRS